jgi:Ca-activated chloride channel family protein
MSMRTRTSLMLVGAAALASMAGAALLASPAASRPQTPVQQPPQRPAFRAGVRTVPVYVTVRDRAGAFITDLTRDDFELRDGGKVQEITQFVTDAQPLSVLVLIDGSSSMMSVFNSVLDAARGFVLRMLPADRTAIASFADIFQMRQPFSGNRDELLAHLSDEFNIRVAGETRLWGALQEGVLALTKEPNRRVILVLSDGKNWTADMRNGFSSPGQALGLALDHDVMVYAIATWTRNENLAERPGTEFQTFARETGGGYVEMKESEDVGALLTQISNELHQQYVLGFTPQVLDGKSHKLEVRVRRPNLTAQSRRSYVAPRADGGGDGGRRD